MSRRLVHGRQRLSHCSSAALGLSLILLMGCESEVAIAKWSCPVGAGGSSGETFAFPWSTGFEDAFCDYEDQGFCYSTGASTNTLVTEPVHSGRYAAAFAIGGDDGNGSQVRCVREGTLPTEAYYGAWYYIPQLARNNGLWNLIHFQGGDQPGETLHGLWDVSLVNKDNGELRLHALDFFEDALPDQSNSPSVPIGEWFHIEVYLKRAADETGAFALYQDGAVIVEASELMTDDSQWAQWYVGNLAHDLEPSEFTVYVDDITVSATH